MTREYTVQNSQTGEEYRVVRKLRGRQNRETERMEWVPELLDGEELLETAEGVVAILSHKQHSR